MIRPLRNELVCEAVEHLEAHGACANCGATFAPSRSWQTFCSSRCRLAAFRAQRVNGAAETHATTDPTEAENLNAVRPRPTPETPVKPHIKNAFQDGGSLLRRILEVEVFGGTWRPGVSSDGIPYEVRRLRPRALQNGNGGRE